MKQLNFVLLLCASLLIAPVSMANDDDRPSPQQVEGRVIKARQGDSQSQYQLGRAYELGSGAPLNAKEAVRWYTAAALQGDARAQFALAMILEKGKGNVKADLAYAISWYEESARNGFKGAKQRLAAMTNSQSGI